jgi:hypothetical protein
MQRFVCICSFHHSLVSKLHVACITQLQDKVDGTLLESNINGKNKYLLIALPHLKKSVSYRLLDIARWCCPSYCLVAFYSHRKLYSTETAGTRDVVSCFYPNKKNRQHSTYKEPNRTYVIGYKTDQHTIKVNNKHIAYKPRFLA